MHRPKRRATSMDALEIRRLLSVYYVSNTGSDAAAGSPAQPFATIQFAASLTHPGDTVNVEPGVYAGFVLGWDSSGLYGPIDGISTAPITIQADPAAAPGSVHINSRNDKSPSGIDLEPGNSFVNILGFNVANYGTITQYGIKVSGSNNIDVLNNSVTLSGKTGIFTSFSNNDLIQGNVSFNNFEHGIYVSNSPVNDRILNNFSYANTDSGIQINADGTQGGSGVALLCVISGNEVFNNGAHGGGALNFDGLQHSFIEGNLLFNNHSGGIVLFQEDASAGSIDNVVANNTVSMPADSRWALEIDTNSTGNVIFNNIFFSASLDHGDISIDATSISNTRSDHNILSGIENLFDENITLPQWRILTGQDFDSIISNPTSIFVNPAANNLHLLDGSSAQGAGVRFFGGVAAPTTDVQAHYWTGTIYDIGAYHQPVRTIPDALNPSLMDLIVVGSTGNDTINFNLQPDGFVNIAVNHQSKGRVLASSLAIIQAYGGLGSDSIGVDPAIHVKARLVGGTGDNTLAASSNADTLLGQNGNDTLIGNGNNGLFLGGLGNNSLQANGASDTFAGGSSDDTIIGAGGDNLFHGQGGNDLIYTGFNSLNTVFGGTGQDTLHARGHSIVPDNDITLILPY